MLLKLFLAQKSQNNLAFLCQFERGDNTQSVCEEMSQKMMKAAKYTKVELVYIE